MKKKLSYSEIEEMKQILQIPRRTCESFSSVEDVKKAFCVPVTSPVNEEARNACNLAFDHAGGYDTIYQSLTQHAFDLGQYPITSFIGYGNLQNIAQNGMIRACVQTVADDITRKWIELIERNEADDNQQNEDFISKLQNLQLKKYRLQKLFHEAAVMTGYMGGAFIFIDTGADGSDLELPLAINSNNAELTNNENLKFKVIDPVNVTPGSYNSINPLKDDYMTPSMWWVLGQRVHASRLIALYDNEPPTLLKPAYNFLGIPQAQILWDYVLHWNECREATAKLLTKFTLLVMQTDTDAVFGSPDGLQQFELKMQALQHYRNNDSVFVCDKTDENVSNVQASLAGCTDIVRQSLEMIAAINRTPAVKLLGISPSGFNATGQSDITNYYDYIHSKQELRRDAIAKCLNCIQLAEFGEINSSVDFDFIELSSDNESSQALTAQTRVNMLATLQDRQVISAEEARQAVKTDKTTRLTFLSDEMPPDLEQENTELQTDHFEGLPQANTDEVDNETTSEKKQSN